MALELIKNERVIEALKPGAGRLNDGGGLYLRPFFRGDGHYWRFDYAIGGKRKTIGLGEYPHLSLAQARMKAVAARAELARGVDPSDTRKIELAAAMQTEAVEKRAAMGMPATEAFEEAARRWFSVKKCQWMDSYSSKVIRRLELHAFPQFGKVPLNEITPKIVLQACRRVEQNDTLETAHRLREHCSSVFRFAIAEGDDLRDPCQDIRTALKQPQVKHFGAPTKPDQLTPILRAINGYAGSFVVRSALQLLPMLMVRPGELRLANWDEFDLDNGLWYVPSMRMKRTKAQKLHGQPHLVPLSSQAVKVLEALFDRTGSSGRVFPAEGRAGRYLSENTLNAALRSMGFTADEATAHGFRATARTLTVEMLQIPEAVVEMQLAHAVKDANGTAYNRTEFVKLRFEMMQAWANFLEDLRTGRSKVEHPALPEFRPVTCRSNSHSLLVPVDTKS